MNLEIGGDKLLHSVPRKLDDENDIDEFDNDLFSMSNSGLSIEELLGAMETKLGFTIGGSWWLDPAKPPVEVINSQGTVDEGAIVDVEAEARAWLRHSFDRNPEYTEHSYHLLDRLEELSRLNGLAAEMSLSKQGKNGAGYPAVGDKAIFHSTLSLTPDELNSHDAPTSQNYGMYSRDRSLELPRIGEGTMYHVNRHQGAARQLYEGSAEAVRRAHQRRSPFAEFSLRSTPSAGGETSTLPPKNRQLSKLAALPQLQKSLQPPLPSPRHPGKSGHARLHHLNAMSPPDAMSSPNRGGAPLSQTYSKDQMRLSKDNDGYRLNNSKSQPFLPVHGNLLRDSALTYSIAYSDRSMDDDLTQSLDRSAQSPGVLFTGATNPLSLSFSAAEAGDPSPGGSSWTGGVRNSLSVIRSTDVYEMARQQESNLRQSSGTSRNQLNGSNNSLTDSVLVGPLGPRASSFDRQSAEGCVHQSLDTSLPSRDDLLQVSAEQIDKKLGGDKGQTGPSRKLSSPVFSGGTSRSELGAKPLSVMDQAASQLELLRASRDRPSKMTLSRDGNMLNSSGDSLHQSTDPIEAETPIKQKASRGDLATHDLAQPEENCFFPPDAETPNNLVTPLTTGGPSSDILFDQQLVADVGDTFPDRLSYGKSGVPPAVGASYDLKEATVAVLVDTTRMATSSESLKSSAPVVVRRQNHPSASLSRGKASGLPRFTGSGLQQQPPGRLGASRIPGFSNPIRPATYQRTGIPHAGATAPEGSSRPSRLRNTDFKEPALGQDSANYPRIHRSEKSPVRSTALRNPRLGKPLNLGQTKR